MKKNFTILLMGLLCLLGTPKLFAVVALEKANIEKSAAIETTTASEESTVAATKKELRKEKRLAKKLQKQENRRPQGMAIAGFVLGLTGLFFPGVLLSVLGLIFSVIALRRYRYAGNNLLKGLAIAGLVLSLVGIFFSLLAFAAVLV